jgi:hypothetical protein
MDSNQTLFSKQLRKFIGVFFYGPKFFQLVWTPSFFPQHDPPTHKRLFCNLAFGHVGKYFRAIRVLTPFSTTPTSSNNTLVFTTLHFIFRWLFPAFLRKLWTKPKPQTFFRFFQVSILMYATFINKWSF